MTYKGIKPQHHSHAAKTEGRGRDMHAPTQELNM